MRRDPQMHSQPLPVTRGVRRGGEADAGGVTQRVVTDQVDVQGPGAVDGGTVQAGREEMVDPQLARGAEIGRASCRERVEMAGGAEGLRKKNRRSEEVGGRKTRQRKT